MGKNSCACITTYPLNRCLKKIQKKLQWKYNWNVRFLPVISSTTFIKGVRYLHRLRPLREDTHLCQNKGIGSRQNDGAPVF